MQEKKIIIGLDLSLAKTGFCILDQCGKVLDSGIIKSKPSGDMPINETKRIVKIAEDIIEIFSDSKKAKLLGENGRKRVKEKFSIERMVKETVDVYKSVLN